MHLSQWILLTMVIFILFGIDPLWNGSSFTSFLQYWNIEPFRLSFSMKGSSSGRTATQKISKWSLKLIKFIRLLLCQRAIKAESPSQMKGSWTAKKTLKRATLIPAVWKKFRPTEPPEKDILQSFESSIGCAVSPSSQLLWAVTHTGVGLDNTAVWVISAPKSNPSPTFL